MSSTTPRIVNSPLASLRPWKLPDGEAALITAPAIGLPPSLDVTVPTIDPVDAAKTVEPAHRAWNKSAVISASRSVRIRARLCAVALTPMRCADGLSII